MKLSLSFQALDIILDKPDTCPSSAIKVKDDTVTFTTADPFSGQFLLACQKQTI